MLRWCWFESVSHRRKNTPRLSFAAQTLFWCDLLTQPHFPFFCAYKRPQESQAAVCLPVDVVLCVTECVCVHLCEQRSVCAREIIVPLLLISSLGGESVLFLPPPQRCDPSVIQNNLPSPQITQHPKNTPLSNTLPLCSPHLFCLSVCSEISPLAMNWRCQTKTPLGAF